MLQITRRVLFAYRLQRQAGLFKAPAALVADAANKVWAQIAGQYLQLTENRGQELLREASRIRMTQEASATFNKFTDIFLNLKLQSYILGKLVNAVQDPRLQKIMNQLIQLAVLRDALRKMAPQPLPRKIMQLSISILQEDWSPRGERPSKELRDLFKQRVESMYHQKYLVLHVGLAPSTNGWTSTNTLAMGIYASLGLPADVRDLLRVRTVMFGIVEHEFEHLAQALGNLYLQMKGYLADYYAREAEYTKAPDGDQESLLRYSPDQKLPTRRELKNLQSIPVGLPSRHIRNPDRDQNYERALRPTKEDREDTYFLDDREFYPWLDTASKIVGELLGNLPGKYHREVFDYFVKSSRLTPEVARYLRSYRTRALSDLIPGYFASFRRNNTGKYRKAITEFYKALVRGGAKI